MGDTSLRFFRVGSNDGVEGEDVGVWGGVEGMAGGGEAAAFGVEEDEVVGEVGGGWEDFDVEGLERFACYEVLFGYACF